MCLDLLNLQYTNAHYPKAFQFTIKGVDNLHTLKTELHLDSYKPYNICAKTCLFVCISLFAHKIWHFKTNVDSSNSIST